MNEKPKIRKFGKSRWLCESSDARGIGPTAFYAYQIWRKTRMTAMLKISATRFFDKNPNYIDNFKKQLERIKAMT